MIGDFEPSIIKTKGFEVGLMKHQVGEKPAPHTHRLVTEINLVVKGKVSIANYNQYFVYLPGDIFVLEPGDPSYPYFYEDTEIVCIKIPSVPDDKELI